MPRCLLLGQPVGVLAGQRAHEPRLAVVDVTGGADRQRHRASIRPSSIADRLEAAARRAARATRAPSRSRPPASDEHQQVEPLRAVRLVARREDRLEDEERAPRRRRRANRAQDRRRRARRPSRGGSPRGRRRHRPARARRSSLDELDALAERRLVADGLRQVEDDAAQPGWRRTSSTSSAPLPPPTSTTSRRPRQSSAASRSAVSPLAAAHRAVEGRTLFGVRPRATTRSRCRTSAERRAPSAWRVERGRPRR